MIEKPLQLGFIGGGLSSAVGAAHFSACQLDHQFQLVAGCFSRQKEVNQETAEKWGVSPERLYSSYTDLLAVERKSIDAVCILTDTPSHIDIIKACLKAKIPIICEKSIVMDAHQAKELASIIKPEDFFVSIFNYTGYPMMRELQASIAQGDFGRIQQIHIEMPQEGLIRPPSIAGKKAPPQNWRLKDHAIPTICLDLGVHMHNLVYFLTGEDPAEVMGAFGNFSRYHGLIDYVHTMMRFESGMQGNLWMTKTALGHRNGLTVRVYGEQASAMWYQMQPEEMCINYLDGRREIIDRGAQSQILPELRYNRFKAGHPAGFIEAFANYYSDIAISLRAFKAGQPWKKPLVFGFEEGARGLEVFEAVTTSAKNNCWVKPNYTA